MGKEERRREALNQDREIQKRIPSFRSAISASKNKYIRKCAESYRNTSHFRDDDFFKHELEIKEILKTHMIKTAKAFNSIVGRSIKSQAGITETKTQSKFDFHLMRWVEREAGRKAKPIAGTTRKDINRAVQRAFKDEAPENVVIKQILGVRGYSNFRADAVARTETHNAAMFASQQTAREYSEDEGVTMKKIWSPTVDDRSREFHLAMEDHPPIPMDALFEVPNPQGGINRMTGPGDTSAPASQVINCRCVLTYEVL